MYFCPTQKFPATRERFSRKGDRIIVPLYHPAAALRSTTVLNDLRAAFGKLPAIKTKLPDLLRNKIDAHQTAEQKPKQERLL